MSAHKTQEQVRALENADKPRRLVVVATGDEVVEAEDATRPLQMPPELAFEEGEPTDPFGALTLAPSDPGARERTVDDEEPTDPFGSAGLVSALDDGADEESLEAGFELARPDTLVGPPRMILVEND